jgi:hypothetical protein
MPVKIINNVNIKKMVGERPGNTIGVRIGYNENNPLLKIANIMEYGTRITVTEKMRKWYLHLGMQIKEQNPKADISMYFLKVGKVIVIPSRPFMQKTFDSHHDEWTSILNHFLEKFNNNTDKAFQALGVYIKSQVRAMIIEGEYEPNSDFTLSRKHGNKPLVDKGNLLDNVAHELIKKK